MEESVVGAAYEEMIKIVSPSLPGQGGFSAEFHLEMDDIHRKGIPNINCFN